MRSAAEYLREQYAAIGERDAGDCVTHACRVAELLQAEGRAPWIGRIRDVSTLGDAVFHGPLIAQRFRGKSALAWTTHYVACSGRDVYDPLAGVPLDVEEYAGVVFGRVLTVDQHLDPDETARLLASGELRQHCRPARRASGSTAT